MSSTKGTAFEAHYRRAISDYVDCDGDETRLMAALELGRMALAEGCGLLDLLAIHHATISSLIEASSRDVRRRLGKANYFLTQVAAPFEMAHLGWHDVVDRLRIANGELEKRVAERTLAHREAEERLDRAQQIAGIGSWELDLETGRQIWSRQMYRICGLTTEPHLPSSGIAAHRPRRPRALPSVVHGACGGARSRTNRISHQADG